MSIKTITKAEALEIFKTRKPLGLFITKDFGDTFTAIDNRTGDAWTEDFIREDVARRWLTDDLSYEEAYELDRRPAPQKPHGEIVEVRMLGYQDINIYEDGYEEVAYTYID